MGPGGAPPPNEPPDDASLGDVFADTPLGEVVLYAAVCIVGGLLVAAFSVHPFVTSGVGLGIAAAFTWMVGRKTSRPWGVRTYVLVFLAAVVALALVGVYVLWVMLCDC
jgi:hypothetical protein